MYKMSFLRKTTQLENEDDNVDNTTHTNFLYSLLSGIKNKKHPA
jgi:hypothetical protein